MPDSALKRLASMSNPGRWYVAALEGVQESSGEGRQDPGWFHPSAFGDPCDARLAFSYLGAPALSTVRAQTRRVFDNGSGRDFYLKRDTQAAGISLVEEFPEPRTCVKCGDTVRDTRHICIPGMHIRGELDEWIKNPISLHKYVVDFKTMRSGLFKDLEAVKPEHLVQVHPYMMDKETWEGYVLYECKDDQAFKCMPANFSNQTWKEEISDRVERILSGLEHDVVYRNPISCTNCPFYANKVCLANKIPELKEASGLYR